MLDANTRRRIDSCRDMHADELGHARAGQNLLLVPGG
jgi:hypothetical protein